MSDKDIPYLRGKLTQKEMQKDAIKSIRERKRGRHKLTYDKETKTIIAVPSDRDKLTQEEITKLLDMFYGGWKMDGRKFQQLIEQLKEIVEGHFKYDYLRNDPECRSVD